MVAFFLLEPGICFPLFFFYFLLPPKLPHLRPSILTSIPPRRRRPGRTPTAHLSIPKLCKSFCSSQHPQIHSHPSKQINSQLFLLLHSKAIRSSLAGPPILLLSFLQHTNHKQNQSNQSWLPLSTHPKSTTYMHKSGASAPAPPSSALPPTRSDAARLATTDSARSSSNRAPLLLHDAYPLQPPLRSPPSLHLGSSARRRHRSPACFISSRRRRPLSPGPHGSSFFLQPCRLLPPHGISRRLRALRRLEPSLLLRIYTAPAISSLHLRPQIQQLAAISTRGRSPDPSSRLPSFALAPSDPPRLLSSPRPAIRSSSRPSSALAASSPQIPLLLLSSTAAHPSSFLCNTVINNNFGQCFLSLILQLSLSHCFPGCLYRQLCDVTTEMISNCFQFIFYCHFDNQFDINCVAEL